MLFFAIKAMFYLVTTQKTLVLANITFWHIITTMGDNLERKMRTQDYLKSLLKRVRDKMALTGMTKKLLIWEVFHSVQLALTNNLSAWT